MPVLRTNVSMAAHVFPVASTITSAFVTRAVLAIAVKLSHHLLIHVIRIHATTDSACQINRQELTPVSAILVTLD